MFGGFTFPECVACIIVAVSALYWYLTRKYGYWKKAGVPYIQPWPFIGSPMFNRSKPMHEFEIDKAKKYGRIYGYYEWSKPALSIADPDLLKNILLKDFQAFSNPQVLEFKNPVLKNILSLQNGEAWKRIRSIVSPTFSTGKMKRMLSIFDECAQTLNNNFLRVAKEGKAIDAKELFGAYCMDVIASAAFSTKLDSLNDPNNKFVQVAKTAFPKKINWKLLLIVCFPILAKFTNFSIFDEKAVIFFRDMILDIIEERKKTGQTHNDFLQLLLDANKENEEADTDTSKNDDIDTNYSKEGNDEQIIKSVSKKKPLSVDELLAQSVTFFVAGYDNLTTVLCLAAYEIAMNNQIQDKVIDDVDQALQNNQGMPTYEAIQQMKYLDNVISETLRLYPIGIRTARVANQDYVLGDTGITIPKGMSVSPCIYAIHQDAEYYPNPNIFDPDRFLPEERLKRPAFTYLPFGGGPRNCVAMRFVLLQMKVCLARVLSRFRFSIDPEMKVPIEFELYSFMMQPKQIRLQLHVREDLPENSV